MVVQPQVETTWLIVIASLLIFVTFTLRTALPPSSAIEPKSTIIGSNLSPRGSDCAFSSQFLVSATSATSIAITIHIYIRRRFIRQM